MFVAVLNQSTEFGNDDAQKAVQAIAAQIKLHAAPMWDMVPAAVVFYANEADAPADADRLVILDDADQADALGYHDETPDGKPYGRVFVRPVIEHGGTALTGSLSVSAVLSHEVCEWFGDRFVNLWADDGFGTEYAVELCDPVEQDSYDVGGVAVSNFVTKRWFDHLAPHGTQVDWLKRLSKPFSMTDGGYVLVRKAGKVEQRFGAAYPAWRKETKRFPAARTDKRLRSMGR